MGILDVFGFGRQKGGAHAHGETDSVRRIVTSVEGLGRLEPARARFLAAFAYVLGRVAKADLHISDAETAKMVEILQVVGHLPNGQAGLVVAIAQKQNQVAGGTEDFLVTREFKTIATLDERRDLLDCLFALSASDLISSAEEAQIRQIASELGFEHHDYVQARTAYSDKRTVLRDARPRS